MNFSGEVRPEAGIPVVPVDRHRYKHLFVKYFSLTTNDTETSASLEPFFQYLDKKNFTSSSSFKCSSTITLVVVWRSSSFPKHQTFKITLICKVFFNLVSIEPFIFDEKNLVTDRCVECNVVILTRVWMWYFETCNACETCKVSLLYVHFCWWSMCIFYKILFLLKRCYCNRIPAKPFSSTLALALPIMIGLASFPLLRR